MRDDQRNITKDIGGAGLREGSRRNAKKYLSFGRNHQSKIRHLDVGSKQLSSFRSKKLIGRELSPYSANRKRSTSWLCSTSIILGNFANLSFGRNAFGFQERHSFFELLSIT